MHALAHLLPHVADCRDGRDWQPGRHAPGPLSFRWHA